MMKLLTELSAGGHQALAVFIALVYSIVTAASVHTHAGRHKYHNMTLRAVSLLREAARSSLKADKGVDPAEIYADASTARIYVSAVDRLLTADEVAKLTGVSLDELRGHVDLQLSKARTGLSKSPGFQTLSHAAAPLQSGGYGQPITAFSRGSLGLRRQ